MCGRFVLLTDLSLLVESFSIAEVACDYRPADNIAPGQRIAAVVDDGKKRLVDFHWGLIPSWAGDPSIGRRMFNARGETVADKPSFRGAFRRRRCLIPVDGFYEWQKGKTGTAPFRISLQSGALFALAGIHESWVSPDNRRIDSCAIITTEANQRLRQLHDRMPVIVAAEERAFWLDPDRHRPEELLPLLKPYPAAEIFITPVTLREGGFVEAR